MILVAGWGNVPKALTALPSIQHRFNTFDKAQGKIAESGTSIQNIVTAVREKYNELFSSVQTSDNVSKLTSSDIALLFQAAREAQFYTCDTSQLRDMEIDLRELQKRGRATQLQYIWYEHALLTSRMFQQARAVAQAHPSSSFERFIAGPKKTVLLRVTMSPVPEFSDKSDGGKTGPTDMVLSPDGRELVRQNFNLHAPAQVIVVISPGCEFAQGGMHAIEADPVLRPVFQNHATWLILQNDPSGFDEIGQWNRAHPRDVMNLAYMTQEWPMLNHWNTPTFYFFKQGKLVAETIGWYKTEVQRRLRQIGL